MKYNPFSYNWRKEVVDFLDSDCSEREAAINFGVGKGTTPKNKKTKVDILHG